MTFVETMLSSLHGAYPLNQNQQCQNVSEEKTCLIGPKTGFAANTTTAFCTVDRVTSASLTKSDFVAIC